MLPYRAVTSASRSRLALTTSCCCGRRKGGPGRRGGGGGSEQQRLATASRRQARAAGPSKRPHPRASERRPSMSWGVAVPTSVAAFLGDSSVWVQGSSVGNGRQPPLQSEAPSPQSAASQLQASAAPHPGQVAPATTVLRPSAATSRCCSLAPVSSLAQRAVTTSCSCSVRFLFTSWPRLLDVGWRGEMGGRERASQQVGAEGETAARAATSSSRPSRQQAAAGQRQRTT